MNAERTQRCHAALDILEPAYQAQNTRLAEYAEADDTDEQLTQRVEALAQSVQQSQQQ